MVLQYIKKCRLCNTILMRQFSNAVLVNFINNSKTWLFKAILSLKTPKSLKVF